MILSSVFHWCHARMFLKVLAKERGIGKVQVVGNFLHRHIAETQATLDSLHGEVLYICAGPTVHHFLENSREIFRSDVQLIGKIFHLTDASVTVAMPSLFQTNCSSLIANIKDFRPRADRIVLTCWPICSMGRPTCRV